MSVMAHVEPVTMILWWEQLARSDTLKQLRCEVGEENLDSQPGGGGGVMGKKKTWGLVEGSKKKKAKAFIFVFLCFALIRQASASWIIMAGKEEMKGVGAGEGVIH